MTSPVSSDTAPTLVSFDAKVASVQRVDKGVGTGGSLPPRYRALASLLALGYIVIVAMWARASGVDYLLFPELGALSYGVLIKPEGRWGHAPAYLVITPVLTAVVGILITRYLPYGFTAVFLCVGSGLAILRVLRSPVAPALSAGFLPLVLGVKSWWYPLGVLQGLVGLAVLSALWKRACRRGCGSSRVTGHGRGDWDRAPVSITPRSALWLLIFVAIATGFVRLTGWRFLLFPPLLVIAYEGLARPDAWQHRSLTPMVRLAVVCLLAAAGGLVCVRLLGVGPLSAVLSMAFGMGLLRLSDLHFPPVLAIALLPQVMNRPTLVYPLAVLLGTILWWACFLLYRSFGSCKVRALP